MTVLACGAGGCTWALPQAPAVTLDPADRCQDLGQIRESGKGVQGGAPGVDPRRGLPGTQHLLHHPFICSFMGQPPSEILLLFTPLSSLHLLSCPSTRLSTHLSLQRHPVTHPPTSPDRPTTAPPALTRASAALPHHPAPVVRPPLPSHRPLPLPPSCFHPSTSLSSLAAPPLLSPGAVSQVRPSPVPEAQPEITELTSDEWSSLPPCPDTQQETAYPLGRGVSLGSVSAFRAAAQMW